MALNKAAPFGAADSTCTEHRYHGTALIEQVIQAYRSGREYYETADQYSADIFGYKLYNRTITKEMYLEYDDMVG